MGDSNMKRFGRLIADRLLCDYVQVWRVRDGKKLVVEKKDAVACLVYNRDRGELALVKQARVATANSNSNSSGIMIEALAGHIEAKRQPWELKEMERDAVATMIREAEEELGVKGVTAADVELLNCSCPLYTCPGLLTEEMWLGYMEIGNHQIEQDDRVFGLAEEGEETERFWLALCQVQNWHFRDMKTFALIQWFLRVKYPQLSGLTQLPENDGLGPK